MQGCAECLQGIDVFSFEILAEDFGLEPSALRRKLREGFALKEKAQKTTLGRTRT